jgi:2-haloacid dehalogenase
MTTSSRPDIVIFDFGGVLLDWNPRYLYRKLFGQDTLAMERFLTEVCTGEWNLGLDAGRPWVEAAAELVARHPEHASLIHAYRERWEETVSGPIEGTVKILGELKRAGLPLYGLTNWSHETFPRAREIYRFLEWFDGIVVSGEERMIKPDLRIYRLLLERYAIAADRAVFIDDNAANVDAASSLGLRAIRYRSPDLLRAELTALDLLT